MGISFDHLLDLCAKGKINVQTDSRLVQPGDIFVAVRGGSEDGGKYAADAAARGAAFIICEDPAANPGLADLPPNCEAIAHPDSREAAWRLAKAKWQPGGSPLTTLGITGTNGKTTTAFILENILTANGKKCGVLGTVEYRWPGHRETAPLTTPGPMSLHSMLAEMASSGAEYAVMEVSSHALDQQRVGGVDFGGAIFTNLTQDHLDYHHDFESYFLAKASLFTKLPRQDKPVAINRDDPYGRRLLELVPEALSFGLSEAPRGHLDCKIMAADVNGLKLEIRAGNTVWTIFSPLVGQFNAMNLLGAQALAIQLGFTPADFACLEEFHGVPGRLERIRNKRGLNIFVDYAHTPDALANALKALRQAGFKRIITVFGCGGNRDRGKRPLMGQAVAAGSDVAILTSDNPRNEDPMAIIRDVLPGLAQAGQTVIEPDRRLATQKGIELLGPGDALLIAGKGHETYQIIGSERRHYSDQETARELAN